MYARYLNFVTEFTKLYGCYKNMYIDGCSLTFYRADNRWPSRSATALPNLLQSPTVIQCSEIVGRDDEPLHYVNHLLKFHPSAWIVTMLVSSPVPEE